jgi:paraquat-inducible protein A
MKIDNNKDLDNLIICHKCHTLHQKIDIEDGNSALCTKCNSVLYHRDDNLLDRGLALSITGLIFFILANSFPLIKVDVLGQEQVITILSMINSLLLNGYYIVALFVSYLIFIFPLLIFFIYIIIFSLMKLEVAESIVSDLLILLARIVPWNMSDIFLISILVALVKLMNMLEIYMGISFWTLVIFVFIDLYMTSKVHLGELWILKEKIYGDK